jgi:hypothetical protein
LAGAIGFCALHKELINAYLVFKRRVEIEPML